MEQKEAIIFAGAAHKQFYEEYLAHCKSKDCWHKALIYVLGITEDIRNHIDEVYDIADDSIDRDSLKAGWVTGTDARVMRFAFTLFTDYVPEDDYDTYSLWNIFGYVSSRFLCQALMLRFES